jgi:AcrR family transcriptional regulator
MAVYTHFSGMDELQRIVREEGFGRLLGVLQAVPETRDPVADLSALGWAYGFNALANPHLYRAVFLDSPGDEDQPVGRAAFAQPVATIDRCIEAGRFRPADAESLATQAWAGAHGAICAVLARVISVQEMIECLSAMAQSLYVGFGDDPARARRSLGRARRRMQPTPPIETAEQ